MAAPRRVPVALRPGVPDESAAPWADAVRELRGLGDVLLWLRGLDPPRAVEAIVTQDEYTHDVVVRATERLYLVFDTT